MIRKKIGIAIIASLLFLNAQSDTNANAGISRCAINVYTNITNNSQDLLLFSGDANGEHTFSYKIPFEVPLRFEFVAIDGEGGNSCDDMTLDFKYEQDYDPNDEPITNSVNLGSDCRAEYNRSLSYQSFLSYNPNPNALYFDLHHNGDHACKLRFDFSTSDESAIHRSAYGRCYYPQHCQGSTEKIQMCQGTIAPLTREPTPGQYIVPNDVWYQLPQFRLNPNQEPWLANSSPFLSCTGTIQGSYPIYLRDGESACNACIDATAGCDTACVNGCTMDSPACKTLQTMRDAGISTCGNSVCEAGELSYVGDPYYCPEDCNVSEGVGFDVSPEVFTLCGQIPDSELKQKCECCMGYGGDKCSQNSNADPNTKPGIWTAVGCIKSDSKSMLKSFISIGLSLAGGLCFLMVIASGFMFSISKGDSKRVSDAKEMLTNAIIGLLFIIFSITILRFLGISILQIPDFGGQKL